MKTSDLGHPSMPRLLGALPLAAILAAAAFAQMPDDGKDVKKFMRAKLVHSQRVLEGLTLENFEAIEKGAQQMSLLSMDASWNVLETEEYYERSADFRRAVEELQSAAHRKNLDGAALAYMGVTLKCIECHRYVRAVQHVEAKKP
jgi:hypothetical protein